jgi:hypothetical protein
MSQAGDSTPPANAALSNRPTFCRNVGLITGCALLVTAGIACVCIFVATLPLLPVLLAAIILSATLAAVCILSIYRLKKLDGKQKKQELSSEPPQEAEPPAETPGGKNPQTGISKTFDRKTNPGEGNPQDGASETPGLGTRFEVEQTIIETSEPKEILDGPNPLSEPTSSGEENPYPPINPIETQESAGKSEPPNEHKELPENPDGEDPGNAQGNVLHPGTDPVETLVQSGLLTPNNSAPKFSGPPADAPETETIMDVNDSRVTKSFRTSVTLVFCGMKDNKFLFWHAKNIHTLEDDKPYFSAVNIDDVWSKFENIRHIEFSCGLPENFQIPGDRLKKLSHITFSFNEIENFETSKHLSGTFDNLLEIAFHKCSKLRSARISGNCTAKNFQAVHFNDCPILDDVHIGNEPPNQIEDIVAPEKPTIRQVHIHPGRHLFGSTKKIQVQLDNCQNLLKEQTHFHTIYRNLSAANSCYGNYTTVHKEMYVQNYLIAGRCGLEQESLLQRTDGISTITLQYPGVSSENISLFCKTLDPHVTVNFDLDACAKLKLTTETTINHLEFTKPINNCLVEFTADPGGTLLDINQFPQNSTTDTGKPFRMSFKILGNNKLPPTIRLNDTNLENIKWYEAKNRSFHTLLIPVIPNNQKKAIEQGWTAIDSEPTWNGEETVELDSDFLFVEKANPVIQPEPCDIPITPNQEAPLKQ